MNKVACRANLWYNGSIKMLSLSDVASTLRREFHLSRRRTMDTLPPHAGNGNTPTKICSKCKREIPATAEYFYRNKGCKDGLLPKCKQCRVESDKVYYDTHVDERRSSSRKYYEDHYEERRAYNASYAEKHRKELREYASKNFAAKHDELCEQQKEYYRKNREELRTQRAKHYQDNCEAIRDKARQYHYTERGKIVHRASSHNRRSRKRNATGTHSAEDLRQQYERQKGKCYYCHLNLGKGKNAYHADHVVPLSRGGSNSIDNIVITCSTCNLKKHSRMPSEWPDGGRLL